MKINFLLFAGLVAAIAACTPAGPVSIGREDLFTLEIGPMEDQLALFNFDGNRGFRQTGFTMRDGFFYIVDGNGGKVVRYNSFGDLLFIIYNDETSPTPVNLKPKPEDDIHVIRWAFTYPFIAPSKIAVDSRRHMYIQERLPDERHRFDEESNIIQDSVILHFDHDGRFIDYLGQGGLGGIPFPQITGLYTSENDDVVVVCRASNGFDVFWYTSRGEQVFLIHFTNNNIPVPEDLAGSFVSVDSIMAAPDAKKLYMKIDYHRNVFDSSGRNRISTEPVKSLIWVFNVNEGEYEINYIDLPFFEYRQSDRNRRENMPPLLYSAMGIARGERILLYYPAETGYDILLVHSGRRQSRGFIRVDPNELHFNEFHFSHEGVLCALLADDWAAKLVWWRMDREIN